MIIWEFVSQQKSCMYSKHNKNYFTAKNLWWLCFLDIFWLPRHLVVVPFSRVVTISVRKLSIRMHNEATVPFCINIHSAITVETSVT